MSRNVNVSVKETHERVITLTPRSSRTEALPYFTFEDMDGFLAEIKAAGGSADSKISGGDFSGALTCTVKLD